MSNGSNNAALMHLPSCGTMGSHFLAFLSLVWAGASATGSISTVIGWFVHLEGIGGTVLGVSIGGAAVVAWAAITNGITLASTPAGTFGCAAGVVNEVVGPDISPFDMKHGRVDLVVKEHFWLELGRKAPRFLWCAACDNCSNGTANLPFAEGTNLCSPILRCYFRSNAVADAAVGAAIGAVVGAVAGAVLGTLAGIAVASALSCAAFTIFAWACWLVVGIALLIALACVGLASLFGLLVGGTAGPGAGIPAGPGPQIVTGTYMSAFGNLVQASDANGANALWFTGWVTNSQGNVVDITQQTASGTALFGTSSGSAPFCHTDPDSNIPGKPCEGARATANSVLALLAEGSLPPP